MSPRQLLKAIDPNAAVDSPAWSDEDVLAAIFVHLLDSKPFKATFGNN